MLREQTVLIQEAAKWSKFILNFVILNYFIIYNPETQVRDLKELMTLYNIKQIQPVDMFPHTSHIENVVLLTRV